MARQFIYYRGSMEIFYGSGGYFYSRARYPRPQARLGFPLGSPIIRGTLSQMVMVYFEGF